MNGWLTVFALALYGLHAPLDPLGVDRVQQIHLPLEVIVADVCSDDSASQCVPWACYLIYEFH